MAFVPTFVFWALLASWAEFGLLVWAMRRVLRRMSRRRR